MTPPVPMRIRFVFAAKKAAVISGAELAND